MGSADGSHARLGHAEVFDLARLDQVLDRPGHVLDGHLRIHAVLVVEIDGVDLQPLEGFLSHLPDVPGLAVGHRQLGWIVRAGREAEFRGDHDLVTHRGEGLTDQDLVRIGSVDFGGVEEGDAQVHGLADEGDHLLGILGRAIGETHAHAAQAKG